jgi:hypothetical protein
LEHRWCPSFTLVTSSTALAGTDSVNWGTLGPPGTLVANPFTIVSTGGKSITVSKALSGSFELPNDPTVDQELLTNNSGSNKQNPITLNFGATTVSAGGAQIGLGFGGEKFTAKVEAFDATGNSLASFTEGGTNSVFIGISSTSANIYQIALSMSQGENKGNFAIGTFDFRTSTLAAAPATASTLSLSAAPSAATFSTAVVIGLPATSPLTQGPALAPAPFLDAAHSSGPPSSMPTIGQALSSPRQAQSAPHIVFAEAEDDDGVFGDHDVRLVSSSPDFKN